MKISFLTSGHDPFDDRIFYHMARSLSDSNFNVEIVSSKIDLISVVNGVSLNCFKADTLNKHDKIKLFIDRLSIFGPDTVICSEPLTILAAKQYSKIASNRIRIIYDVTEWYPSKKNLKNYRFPIRWLVFIKLLSFNLYVTRYVNSFIFGEFYKSRPYRFLFPRKPYIFASYFPDLKYIDYSPTALQRDRVRLTYSGRISLEKGYGNFFKVLQRLSVLNKDLKIEVLIIGWYESPGDKEMFEVLLSSLSPKITFQIYEKQSFEDFINIIKETDIFLDLRSDDFENQICLPIKLFYYAALGRPVIYSDLKAIRKEVEISRFGFLVNPNDHQSISRIILDYLDNEELYYLHCKNARELAQKSYNWGNVASEFLNFISI
jgi:glycosyltransferase involved in cell wall biosynthesis